MILWLVCLLNCLVVELCFLILVHFGLLGLGGLLFSLHF